ncbi:BamA/TamA family outer membrane protein [Williamwhitmania taraxaci]|uniref:Outer membrane protein assembly factor BamA n=1 Tax=Williamwhitmania taraxaci TaxID=1640674 RepID=A0A1G6GWG9_9BACT|nr:hypothetical protein [Williamwhitmania taraxaci]SDB86005.1 hypothetical protein SAMN05216323_100472 [Williamwhitmania taraxaci]
MWFKILLILILTLLLSSEYVVAQVPIKTDSTKIYKEIQNYSKRSKFTKLIYRLVFKPLPTKKTTKRNSDIVKKRPKSYSAFEGKIIRRINIVTLDPFGFSIGDTSDAPQFIAYKIANKAHVKTRRITVLNLLLINKNDSFNSFLVRESERLIRKQSYIHEVSINAKLVSSKSDSVDLYIRVSDIWSIIPDGSISASSATLNLTDKNFLGTGHEFQNAYTQRYTGPNNSFKTNYYIPNIKNTYINTTLRYETNGSANNSRSLSFDRPFFSPMAKWAAGVYFAHQFSSDSIYTSNSLYILQRLKYNTQDYWGGSAIQLFEGISESDRATNFISTIRFLRIRYIEKPIETLDLDHTYSDENLYLASMGISTRKYIQDHYVFKHGVTEDVPVGNVYSLTAGYQEKDSLNRFYFGARISFGNYYTFGHLSTNLEYGTFYRASKAEQGVISTSITYFSKIMEVGKWKFRQFAKPEVTIGTNRFSNDSLTLKDGYGLDGFNSSALSGPGKLVMTLQTQAYAPWNFFGFRFGPYLSYSMGMISDTKNGFRRSKVYSRIGLGVLIKNENLVFSTFQLSFSFYPIIPGIGPDVFKANSFRTSDFGLRDFEIEKPRAVQYQ